MKRMTTRVYGKSSLVKGMSIFDIEEAVDRLAAYEDTGLEPKEIDEVFDEYNDVLKAIIKDGERMITNDRLRELAEADREGRCVVLPRLEPWQGDPPGEPGPQGLPGEVVFCKDCDYIEYSDCYGECGRGYLGIVKPYDYCSRGMRRDKQADT